LDSSESDYKEIPLAFLANSPNGEESGDDDDDSDEDDSTSNEDASVSAELLNPVETPKIEEPPQKTADKSLSDETGTCVETTPIESDSDENGTCLPTTETPDEDDDESSSESDEIPKIIMTKTIITDDDESESSEPVDMVINPFLPISDVAEILKQKIDESDESFTSDELSFNLIDSNDIKKYSEDIPKNVRQEEKSFIHKRFTGFIDALMNAFAFA
jgi:hypothetical protein